MNAHATAVRDQLRQADEDDELPDEMEGRLFMAELEVEQRARRTRVRELILEGADDA